jgi:hypothetical protein
MLIYDWFTHNLVFLVHYLPIVYVYVLSIAFDF